MSKRIIEDPQYVLESDPVEVMRRRQEEIDDDIEISRKHLENNSNS